MMASDDKCSYTDFLSSVSFNWKLTNGSLSSILDVNAKKCFGVSTQESNSNSHKSSNAVITTTKREGIDDMEIELKPDTTNEACCLVLKSSYPHYTITSITIQSNARILELSNYLDGYITTVKGTELAAKDNCSNQQFLCDHNFSSGYIDLSIKFQSIQTRQILRINSIFVAISIEKPKGPNIHSFDMLKLRKNLDEMGDVSSRAKDLLSTVEQFQQNQLQSTISSCEKAEDSLNVVISSLNSNGIDQLPQFASSLLPKLMGFGNRSENAPPSSGKNCSQPHIDNSDKESNEMFQFLQSMCGRVTEMRNLEEKTRSEDTSSEANKDEDATKHKSSSEYSNDRNCNNDLMLEQLKGELHNHIDKVKDELMLKIEENNKALNNKIDKIIELLSNLS